MKPTLLILAAGIGSRYGSVKQMDAMGPNGETLLEYSIWDAIRAGFKKVVFVINKKIEKDFNIIIISKLNNYIECDYVLQEVDKLPENINTNPLREKPWGTVHALLMAEEKIKEPFVSINADDFYGANAYKKAYDFFKSDDSKYAGCLISYNLQATVPESGPVTRAICKSQNDLLTEIVEIQKISKKEDKYICLHENNEEIVDGSSVVSMNMWGFKPSIFTYFKADFINFLASNKNELTKELVIPTSINDLIAQNNIKIKLINSESEWFGITYQSDKQLVKDKIKQLIIKSLYPEKLWNK